LIAELAGWRTHPCQLSATDCLYSVFTVSHHIWWPSPNCNFPWWHGTQWTCM